jgi:hypothetical protein
VSTYKGLQHHAKATIEHGKWGERRMSLDPVVTVIAERPGFGNAIFYNNLPARNTCTRNYATLLRKPCLVRQVCLVSSLLSDSFIAEARHIFLLPCADKIAATAAAFPGLN